MTERKEVIQTVSQRCAIVVFFAAHGPSLTAHTWVRITHGALVCDVGATAATPYPNINEALKAERSNIIPLLIKGAKLTEELSNGNTAVTLFVPSDASFLAMARTTPLGNPAVLTNERLLKIILNQHTIPSTSVKAGSSNTRLAGYPLQISSLK